MTIHIRALWETGWEEKTQTAIDQLLEACTQMKLGRTMSTQHLEPHSFVVSLQSQYCRQIFLGFLAEEGNVSTVRYARTFYFILFLLTRSTQ